MRLPRRRPVTADPHWPVTLIGRKVRARVTGEGVSTQIDPRRHERKAAPFRLVVKGEVIAWEDGRNGGGETYVIVAGYGRVPAAACRPWPWWRPWL